MINQYEIFEELGRGVHGKVKLARNLETNEYVAIKIVQRYSKRRRLGKALHSSEDKVKKEIAILKKALHPHVVSMLEVIDDPEISKIYIVLEFCELREIDWRIKGSSEIVLMENRRLEREAQGLDPGSQNDKLMKAAERHREKARRRRPKPMRTITSESDFWSLEYAGESDEEEENNNNSNNTEGVTTSPVHVTESIQEEDCLGDVSRTPSSLTGSPLTSNIISPISRETGYGTPRPLAGSAEAQRNLFSAKWFDEPTEVLASIASSVSDSRGRKTSIAESISSQLTDLMEQEIQDEYRYVPTMTIAESRSAFRDAVLGLEYLHYQGIVHRDIKPANLLRTKDHRVKISDFGVSYLGKPIRDGPDSEEVSESEAVGFEEETELAKTVGTPSFYAPELCSLDFNYDMPVVTGQIDVWALGVTLYCLLYARTPFTGENEFALMRRIAESDVFIPRKRLMAVDTRPSSRSNSRGHLFRFTDDRKRLPHEWIHEQIDDDLYDLLKRLFEKDPTKRITLREVKHHPWILQDISNPSQWLDDTDPARHTEGKKIEISKEEVAGAVIPLKPVLERARSLVKRVGGVFGNIGRGSRKRATSSAASSEIGVATTPSADPTSPTSKRSSMRIEDSTIHTLKVQGLAEHPLSQSLTASPGTEPEDDAPDPPAEDNPSLGTSRPNMLHRTNSSMSTGGSSSTVYTLEPPVTRVQTESPPPIGADRHKPAESSSGFYVDHFSGLRRVGDFTKSHQPNVSVHASPYQQNTAADLLTPGHLHAAPKSAVNSAPASGEMEPPRKNSLAESLGSSRRSSVAALDEYGSPGGLRLTINAHRPSTPILSSPVRHRINPVDFGGGMSRGAPHYTMYDGDATDEEWRRVQDQQMRRRKLEHNQTRHAPDSYRTPTSAGGSSCPPSPDDALLAFGSPSTVRSPQVAQHQCSPHHQFPETRQFSPQGMYGNPAASSASSEGPPTSRSTSFPSIPSAISANSSVIPEAEYSYNIKDDSASSSDGTAKANYHDDAESFSQKSPADIPTLVLGEDAIQTDEDDSESDYDFIVMSKSKKRLETKDRDRRETSIKKCDQSGSLTPIKSRDSADGRRSRGKSHAT